jgi:aspartate carbamoyltransferase catalytic subunit
MSFLLAGDYLGAVTNDLNIATSAVNKGETLIDTGQTLDAMGTQVIIIRHSKTGAPHLLANHVKASVINGGDGTNEHPTQALLDMFTIQQHKKSFEGLKVVIVGDIASSRVARSNVFALTKLGAEVVLAGPSTLLSGNMESLGGAVKTTVNVSDAIIDADVVMGLRIQKERHKAAAFPSLPEYIKFFGVTKEMMRRAKPDAIIMHPGPTNRGVELCADLIDGDQSVITEQVENGVAMRMAILQSLVEANAHNHRLDSILGKQANFHNPLELAC